jgi:hypothetical protein
MMATPASMITAGELNADGIDDLIGIWPSQGGVWVKYSQSGSWAYLSSSADWIAAGKMRAASGLALGNAEELPLPMGELNFVEPQRIIGFEDLSVSRRLLRRTLDPRKKGRRWASRCGSPARASRDSGSSNRRIFFLCRILPKRIFGKSRARYRAESAY